MNKFELATKLAMRVGINKKQAEDTVDALVDVIIETLKENSEVTIASFGTFSARQRKGRTGVNPQRPTEKMEINPVVVAKFKPGKRLKDTLKGRRV